MSKPFLPAIVLLAATAGAYFVGSSFIDPVAGFLQARPDAKPSQEGVSKPYRPALFINRRAEFRNAVAQCLKPVAKAWPKAIQDMAADEITTRWYRYNFTSRAFLPTAYASGYRQIKTALLRHGRSQASGRDAGAWMKALGTVYREGSRAVIDCAAKTFGSGQAADASLSLRGPR